MARALRTRRFRLFLDHRTSEVRDLQQINLLFMT
jgi:hypothetical protein